MEGLSTYGKLCINECMKCVKNGIQQRRALCFLALAAMTGTFVSLVSCHEEGGVRQAAARLPAVPTGVPTRQARLVVHTAPFDFQAVDTARIVGSSKEQLMDIPFDQAGTAERTVGLPEVTLTNGKGDVADEVHIFNPPGGSGGFLTTRKFLFKNNTLIELTMGIDSGDLAREIQQAGGR